jgi:hypothetical protein
MKYLGVGFVLFVELAIEEADFRFVLCMWTIRVNRTSFCKKNAFTQAEVY